MRSQPARTSAEVRERYDRIARVYDRLEGPMERMTMARWREQQIALAKGPRVLEAGVGTGKNLPYYPAGLHITAIDLSPKMLEASLNKPCASPVERKVMDVEHLEFPDNRFDTVVASFLFCSVADPVRGLCELNRVVKPDGRMVLLEHVRPGNPVLARLFDLLNPITVRLIGPNINRDTLGNIRKAGLFIEEDRRLLSDIVHLVICRKGDAAPQQA